MPGIFACRAAVTSTVAPGTGAAAHSSPLSGKQTARTFSPSTRIAVIRGNFSPRLSTREDGRASAGNACTPSNSSWMNRIEAQFTALRYFAPDGTGHAPVRSRPA
jgi:hypothetical protein